MYYTIGDGTEVVDLGSARTTAPNTVEFRLDSGCIVSVATETFQALRRGTKRNTDGRENKIFLIKNLRGIMLGNKADGGIKTGLNLRDAKQIVEWFLDNIDIGAEPTASWRDPSGNAS